MGSSSQATALIPLFIFLIFFGGLPLIGLSWGFVLGYEMSWGAFPSSLHMYIYVFRRFIPLILEGIDCYTTGFRFIVPE